MPENPILIIDSKRNGKEYVKDLLRYRELFYFFAWRDILVRYKQAFFGVSWALVRPLLNMAAFTFLFGSVAHLPSENVNYALFVLAAMLPWQLYSNSLVDTCNSLLVNTPLVSKVYFPRMIIPIAQIIVHSLDFGITAVLLIFLSLIMGELNSWTFLLFPLFTLHLAVLCVGLGLWLSALTVKYRDFRLIVPFFVQFSLFISPVGYGTFIIPEKWQGLYLLNPIVGVIDGFRWAFFGITYPNLGYSIAMSLIITLFLFISGFLFFQKSERSFADRI